VSSHESAPESHRRTSDPLKRLEAFTNDWYFEEVRKQADQVEEFINSTDSSLELRAQAVGELDKKWRYMQHPVEAWGRLYSWKSRLAANIPEYETRIIEGETLISNGFTIVPFAAVLEDEVIVQYKVAYSFTQNDQHVAMLRDGFAGKFPDSSPDMARRRIEYHHMDEVVRVREKLQRANKDSVSSVMAFNDYEIEIDELSTNAKDYVSDMELYLLSALKLDKEVPYIVECELDEFDDGSEPSIVNVIARAEKINLLPKSGIVSNPQPYVPWITLTVFDANPKNPNTQLVAPVYGLRRFDSVRHLLDDVNE
jgi:hypothetical protein